MDASSSGRVFEAPPSLAALQSWVHRPQALALCFVSDVYALRALREETNLVTRTTRDVFLLDHFPCKFVQLVGWVAGVDHKDTSMTITLDDGDGDCVLNVSVKLAQVELKVEKEKEKKEARTTFRSVRERVARPPPPQPKNYYVRPDIIVGDTVRLSGYVEEWMRKSDTVRQVVVDEESGSGYVLLTQMSSTRMPRT
ncbi:hypothetical protein CcaverHIS002_0411580 [Cutaneotrichosporon cavernicola]|uniref:CST complex subunit Stn1 N-terminal domain-containing protein n=1 Tax=Cutaneotrichosporon cavernicola TaxID=279322 RepID=A0AA48L5F5_9TREE|nr:uncharacterized protein CcaverHIS019_0411510 [Cutaneotrichosporon cavernicola]BEI84554.1 hypothetical protein CcaverHIS002_0411580 [Cutaneotrichosporon cavernicola]BEI92331.1 hypothetical protein CcaverHIS019_0411510 [Cutaneotrichosporon cavernicola]BEJ00101.1 hypothetical protein CcaverHIS631_0411430 [Cutaneotrichosporon cavernicola]BEJ07872.1 hypothetical protein CcaverHIS641_0411410 [Cutaneotrichosporon cavernicola]